MLKNYFILAIRNFSRNKFNTIVNVLGLAVGMACCIVVYVLVKHEYTFDDYFSQKDAIYRVVSDTQESTGIVHHGSICFPMATALRDNFSSVKYATQVYINQYAIIKTVEGDEANKRFEDYNLAYVDSSFPEIFDYQTLAGVYVLNDFSKTILTQSLADKLFGNAMSYDELIGKAITINGKDFQIACVVADPPGNTSISFSLLLPFAVFEKRNAAWANDWNSIPGGNYAFALLEDRQSIPSLEAQINNVKNHHLSADVASKRTYRLQSLASVHTDETYGGTVYATPHIFMAVLVTMGAILILVACINFISISTAQTAKRAREIGIRKALGGLKSEMMVQFMGETWLLTTASSLLALLLAYLFLAKINNYLAIVSNTVQFDFQLDSTVFLFILILSLVVTFLSGFYPALVLAGSKPVEALKQSFGNRKVGFNSKLSLNKVLIIIQFAVGQTLMIGTIVVAMQTQFLRQKDLGFTKENILTVGIPSNNPQQLSLLRNQLTSLANINNISFASGPPTSIGGNIEKYYDKEKGVENSYNIQKKCVDTSYLAVYNIPLVAGRNLREEDKVVTSEKKKARYSVLVNEKAVKTLGFRDPSKALHHNIMIGDDEATIVGIVADFFNVSLQNDIQPCFLYYGNWLTQASVRIDMNGATGTLPKIQEAWENIYPDGFYSASFLDDYLSTFYILEDLMYQIFKIFAFLAVVISCLGLYGLVSHLSINRRKEIGVRKALGASTAHVTYLFMKEFTALVFFSFLLAAPLGYYIMNEWLSTSAHRISLHAGYFVVTLVIATAIALVTVGYKSFQAASVDPVRSLRSE